MSQIKTSIIITIYKDLENLPRIIASLENQIDETIELVFTEDNNDEKIAKYLSNISKRFNHLIHLSQQDNGFRKNRALNRAVVKASGEYLIFLDGDCVPHKDFIRSHLRCAEPAAVCTGRRVEFGPVFSFLLKRSAFFYRLIHSPVMLLVLYPFLLLDKIKNFEVGFRSEVLYQKTRHRPIRLLGCNFSVHKQDLVAVNGFNEQYTLYGIGEDSDVEWRLNQNGVRTKNIKFLAPVYHLHHHKRVGENPENLQRFAETKAKQLIQAPVGLSQYLEAAKEPR